MDENLLADSISLLFYLSKYFEGDYVKNLATNYLRQNELEKSYLCFSVNASKCSSSVEKYIQDLPDGHNIFRALSGNYINVESKNHLYKHFRADTSKPHHGIFLITKDQLENILNTLDRQKPHHEGRFFIYHIPCQNAGYDGGYRGDSSTLNWITVITFLNSSNIVTAYPSDGNH